MHGSTSPLKNGWPACSQRQCSRTCATARRTSSSGGRHRSRAGARDCRPWRSRAGLRSRRSPAPARETMHLPPTGRLRLARPAAGHPNLRFATRARSAATISAGASARSRNTCQRIAGSDSSSQSRRSRTKSSRPRESRRFFAPLRISDESPASGCALESRRIRYGNARPHLRLRYGLRQLSVFSFFFRVRRLPAENARS